MPPRQRRCPNCDFSYAWDGEFCGHCHSPYPRLAAWEASTEPHWFYRHHRAPVNRLALFSCACLRTVGRLLPGDAREVIDALEEAAVRRAKAPAGLSRQCESLREQTHFVTPVTSPVRAAADALAQLGLAAGGSDPAVFFQVAYLVGTAEGLSRVPDTPDERVARPTFLDQATGAGDPAFRQAVVYGRLPPGLSPQQRTQWDNWRAATTRAEKTRQERTAATRGAIASLCDLYRDVVPFPFEPVAFPPVWRTSTAVAMAKEMLASRDFSAMPILADALQDAGCEDAAVLRHCRASTPHVTGCWVTDMVLGRG